MTRRGIFSPVDSVKGRLLGRLPFGDLAFVVMKLYGTRAGQKPAVIFANAVEELRTMRQRSDFRSRPVTTHDPLARAVAEQYDRKLKERYDGVSSLSGFLSTLPPELVTALTVGSRVVQGELKKVSLEDFGPRAGRPTTAPSKRLPRDVRLNAAIVKVTRIAAGYRLDDFADCLGVSRSTALQISNGSMPVRMDFMQVVRDTFPVQFAWAERRVLTHGDGMDGKIDQFAVLRAFQADAPFLKKFRTDMNLDAFIPDETLEVVRGSIPVTGTPEIEHNATLTRLAIADVTSLAVQVFEKQFSSHELDLSDESHRGGGLRALIGDAARDTDRAVIDLRDSLGQLEELVREAHRLPSPDLQDPLDFDTGQSLS